MQVHYLILISKFLRQLEKQTHLERAVLKALFSLSLCLLVLAQSVETARLVDVDLLVLLTALNQFIIHRHSLAKKYNRIIRTSLKLLSPSALCTDLCTYP